MEGWAADKAGRRLAAGGQSAAAGAKCAGDARGRAKGGVGEQSDERTDGIAAGAAAVVRDALVVSAGRHRDDAAGDDARGDAPCGGGYDATSASDAARLDAAAASGGHVFCLTAPVTSTRPGDEVISVTRTETRL